MDATLSERDPALGPVSDDDVIVEPKIEQLGAVDHLPCEPKILPGLGLWSRLPSSTGAFFVYFHLRHRPVKHDAPPGQLGLHQLHHTQGFRQSGPG
jgi:hypothetical protein